MDINLNLYKTFLVVAQSKSYSDASNKMFVSTTAISKNISQLESVLNTQLFYRDNNGVKLTEEGEKLYSFVEQSLKLLNAGEKMISQKNDIATGEITIGALSHISSFLLMDKIEKAKKEYPNLKLKLITGHTGKNLVELLEQHKIDFAIDSTKMDVDNELIIKKPIMEIENIFVSNKPLKINDIEELKELKYILGLNNTHTSQELIELMKEHNVNIEPNLEIDITELKIDAVQRGLGIGYVMKNAVKKYLDNNELFEVEIPFKLPISQINLIYLKNQLNQADKQFIKKYLKEE